MSEKVQRAASRQAQLSKKGKKKNKPKKNPLVRPQLFQTTVEPADSEPTAREENVSLPPHEPHTQITPRPAIYGFIGPEIRRFAIIGGTVLVILVGISFFVS